ncbi:lipase family protein [Streptomyces rubellomurinus]|uniref:Triacylglycerol lipase n=1 Tax=Streptomyces rubellomurinus (strain ATCC 31215) TaxID=359131 RepID=A0A0F2T8P2_STRR3|nr:lipase family protein [Streptomyces rubellomurinus]KJS59563.1 triacylglycerol lipase [Streptomyces rubellomurinus]
MRKRTSRLLAAAVTAALTATTLTATATAATAGPASASSAAAASDPFYSYDGSTPLDSLAPGTVLRTRTLPYHVLGLPTPVTAVQLLYRTADAQGRPAANVTTVLRSLTGDSGRAVSYQSFYDSLDPADGPSRAVAGNLSLGGAIPSAEAIFLVPLLAQGYNVVIPDTEGQSADFGAGPEYAITTLDSIRAATGSPATGLTPDTRFGLMGYSGGAVASSWAAALAPGYAPEVNARLVGYAEGGLLVDPAHNIRYIDGSLMWSGIIPMALIGVSRSSGIDLTPYLNDYGRSVYRQLEHASLTDALGHYPGLSWKAMAKPQYADPNSVEPYVAAVNRTNLGSAPTPTVPGYLAQGNAGVLEGTFANPPGIGTGDGVAVAGDVRALARQYCASGTAALAYQQYDALSHFGVPAAWAPQALAWLNDRFAGRPAPSDCGHIPAGNSLAPQQPVPAS